MNIISAVIAALNAFRVWCEMSSIRERRELRNEAKTLRHEIIQAADAGDSRRLAELQNSLADNQRDSAALLAAASSKSP